ncbi:hypothetical protein ACA910_006178 [Epithemia clementina (nom. ined.)]
MGLWDKVKAGTKKTRLQGELALLDREMTNRKYAFGVELYNLLVTDAKVYGGGVISSNSKAFQLQQTHLSEPFEACRSDIRDLEAQQQAHRNEQEILQASRMRGEPPSTAGEHLAKAGQWVSTNAVETKLEAQIKLLDRDIRRRKEMFGVQAYDSYLALGLAEPQAQQGGGMRERLSARMSQYSPKEKRIQECLDRTKNAMGLLERQHAMKVKEIESLDEIIKGPRDSATAQTQTTAW